MDTTDAEEYSNLLPAVFKKYINTAINKGLLSDKNQINWIIILHLNSKQEVGK